MRKHRRFALPLVGLATAIALSVPFLFWYQTWFGRELSVAEIDRCLEPAVRPRDMQHALSQLAAEMERGDKRAQRWYPAIVALSRHRNYQIRGMTAWVMGQDNQSMVFHQTLLVALSDRDVTVRRNAALSLVRFGDGTGRAELTGVLRAEPDDGQIWEALRGLYLMGQTGDLAAVEAYQLRAGSAPAAIRAQAQLTVTAIRSRSGMSPL